MTVTIPGTAPALSGQLVNLKQLDPTHLNPYIDLINDEETHFWTASSGSFTAEQLTKWLQSRPGAEDRLDWAILQSDTAEFLGEIVLNELDSEQASMNLRIALLSSKTSRGFGSEAVALVTRFAFEELLLREIKLEVLESNLRAIRSYEKSGFIATGKVQEDEHTFLKMHLVRS
jgi:RimJ/RimL family protein N-acetyltransferase